LTEEEFFRRRMTQDAVVRQLEIVGEATRNLSDAFRAAHSEVPWRDIVAMRNRIAHAYFDVDLQVVWEVVTNDLPALKQFAAAQLMRASNTP
jgi:uncharacterized protein with HEPN domain